MTFIEWADNGVSHAGYGVLHALFEKQADANPDAIAVVSGRTETSYAELEGRANRMARHLRAHGVGRGARVGLLLPRSTQAYAALLGILKAGAAYVPIDPEYRADRIAFILANSGAHALATTADLASLQPNFRGLMICLDTDCARINAESPSRLPRSAGEINTRDLCHIIYTSGSTGRPKGVMIEHRSAVHRVREERHLYGVHPRDRVFQGASLAFDLSVEEIWLAFGAGATLIAAPRNLSETLNLARFLTEHHITVLSGVPTLLSILAEDVPSLRLLIFRGGKCHERFVDQWSRPGRRMLNTYGPTEATVVATCAELLPGKPVTLGHAVPGCRVHVLDERLHPVPRGVSGEICIGGVGVARVYVGLPEQTRARFVSDPFAAADEPDARLYRTGDMGRFDEDGNLKFLGRVDGQVKLRAFRVELAEIESVMLQGEGVAGAACTVREDTPGAQQLVGYVTTKNGPVDEDRLRQFLRERLPAHLVPALIETIAELPRLASGKLDRAALPAPRKRDAAVRQCARPLTETERLIRKVWQSLFHPRTVGVKDDFIFDLGGHSLLTARTVSELRKEPRFARGAGIDPIIQVTEQNGTTARKETP